MNPQEYEARKKEILELFPKEFAIKYREDQWAKNIVESLILGESPYNIIDYLLTERIKAVKQLENLISIQNIAPILLKLDENNPLHIDFLNQTKGENEQ